MTYLFQSKSLGRTIIGWFLLLSVRPMTLVAWISYQQANISLTQNAKDKLEFAANSKISFLNNWFKYRFKDVSSQAENRHNIHLLAQLEEGFQQSSKNSEEYVRSFDWAQRVDALQDPLINLVRHYSYIYDILLIDTTGNILYSVVRESDLGTNLFTGPLSDTRFTRSVKTTLKTGQSLFSDLERYAPSKDQLAGFFTAPLLDEFGNIAGVFAYQVQFENITDKIIAINAEHSNSSQVHYLLGVDGHLRSKIKYNYSDVLNKVIDNIPFQQWRKRNGEDRKLPQETFHYIGIDGNQVIGLYQNIQLPGVEWVLVSEIDQSEALADAHWLGATTLILVVLTGLSVALLAICQARRIVQPISQLVNASKAVSAGDVEKKVVVTADNEIGGLAKAFNHMLAVQNEHAKALEMSHKQTEQALNDLAMQNLRWISIPLSPLRMSRGLLHLSMINSLKSAATVTKNCWGRIIVC